MDMNYRGEMWEGGGGQDGVEWGEEWDNCNSIINKYIKKKKRTYTFMLEERVCFPKPLSPNCSVLHPSPLPLPFSNETPLLFPICLTEFNACWGKNIVTACANNIDLA